MAIITPGVANLLIVLAIGDRGRPYLQSLRPNVASPAIRDATHRRDKLARRRRWGVHWLPHRGDLGTAAIPPDALHHRLDQRLPCVVGLGRKITLPRPEPVPRRRR